MTAILTRETSRTEQGEALPRVALPATSEPTGHAVRPPTRASFVRLSDLSLVDVLTMYAIFETYYENTSLETFTADLSKKRGAFIVRDRNDGDIVGFSTMVSYTMQIEGRRIRGLFSGDTVLRRDYWGETSLRVAFIRWALIQSLLHPLTPQYWLLISKGYKTFLLFHNNFYEVYPSPDGTGEHLKPFVEAYCEYLFPGKLDRETMLLDFGDDYCRLREGVAPITPGMTASNRGIALFEAYNPTWWRGTELPCIARCDYKTFVQAVIPQLRKVWRRARRVRA